MTLNLQEFVESISHNFSSPDTSNQDLSFSCLSRKSILMCMQSCLESVKEKLEVSYRGLLARSQQYRTQYLAWQMRGGKGRFFGITYRIKKGQNRPTFSERQTYVQKKPHTDKDWTKSAPKTKQRPKKVTVESRRVCFVILSGSIRSRYGQ